MAWKRPNPKPAPTPAPPVTHEDLVNPTPRLHRAVVAVQQGLGEVASTLNSRGEVGQTARTMVSLGPQLTELGHALAAWDKFIDSRRIG